MIHLDPLLSVVIPSYNAGIYIAECLHSVLAQQDCPPFEVIVVDDGSTDGTAELVERDFPTVRLIRKPNGGPGSARNLGVDHARTDVIVFIDADDIMLPGRLALQGRFMLESPRYGVSFGNPQYQSNPEWDANGTHGVCESEAFSELANAYSRFLVEGGLAGTSTCSVRKTAYVAAGGQPVHVYVAEDYAMYCALSRQWPIAASRRFLTWVRQEHDGHLMKSPHTYRGPVVVLRDELLNHGQRLTPPQYKKALKRWCDITNMLLRWVWIESGRGAVLAEMATLQPFLPWWLYTKWYSVSLFPPATGRYARIIKRFAIHKFSKQ